MAHTLELPETLYSALEKAAKQSGTTVADWIAARLPESNGPVSSGPSEAEIQAANARLDACIVDFGSAFGLDNDSIDADLAGAYAGSKGTAPK